MFENVLTARFNTLALAMYTGSTPSIAASSSTVATEMSASPNLLSPFRDPIYGGGTVSPLAASPAGCSCFSSDMLNVEISMRLWEDRVEIYRNLSTSYRVFPLWAVERGIAKSPRQSHHAVSMSRGLFKLRQTFLGVSGVKSYILRRTGP